MGGNPRFALRACPRRNTLICLWLRRRHLEEIPCPQDSRFLMSVVQKRVNRCGTATPARPAPSGETAKESSWRWLVQTRQIRSLTSGKNGKPVIHERVPGPSTHISSGQAPLTELAGDNGGLTLPSPILPRRGRPPGARVPTAPVGFIYQLSKPRPRRSSSRSHKLRRPVRSSTPSE